MFRYYDGSRWNFIKPTEDINDFILTMLRLIEIKKLEKKTNNFLEKIKKEIKTIENTVK